MNHSEQETTLLMHVPVQFVEALLKMHDSLKTDMCASVLGKQAKIDLDAESIQTAISLKPRSKYSAEYLGKAIHVETLPEVFATVVDLTNEVAPEALEILANMRARKRRFISRTADAIHPGKPTLPVEQTASGWWISKNVGQEDLIRALNALCDASGLKFGEDIKFPVEC
ncbi:MAG: hypothetical protein ACSHXD_13685 [Marinosulfonomonas sp.]